MIILDQQKVTIILLSLVCCSLSIALAPATVGEIAASTGKLSNRLKVSTRRIFQLRGSSVTISQLLLATLNGVIYSS